MSHSFVPKKGLKEYAYYRYSFKNDEVYRETVYAKNDQAVLIFLNEMNNKEKYSKYFSEKAWDELREVNSFLNKETRNQRKERYQKNKGTDLQDMDVDLIGENNDKVNGS